MPRRRSGLDASNVERRQEEALARRVERWMREGALPTALDMNLKAWVEAERCGHLLGQVTVFRASRGLMISRKFGSREADDLYRLGGI